MAANSSIQWTDATWNALAGCSIVSPGCHNCYAMQMAGRLAAMGQQKYVGTTKKANGRTLWTGRIRLDFGAIDIPLRWKKPRRVFVNSMSDLFHADVPDGFIDRVFAVMALCGQHVFQVLTKRAERLPEYFGPDRSNAIYRAVQDLADQHGIADYLFDDWPWPHVWLGVSVEDQQRADERTPHLLNTPAAVRFVSDEPMLGWSDPVPGIDWWIIGCESIGPRVGRLGEFKSEAEWIDAACRKVELCRVHGIAPFIKQIPANGKVEHDVANFPEALQVREFPTEAPHADAR